MLPWSIFRNHWKAISHRSRMRLRARSNSSINSEKGTTPAGRAFSILLKNKRRLAIIINCKPAVQNGKRTESGLDQFARFLPRCLAPFRDGRDKDDIKQAQGAEHRRT